NLIGSYGDAAARTRNFATFSLGASISAFLGPSMAGFSIDGWGFHAAFVLIAIVALMPALIIGVYPKLVPPRTSNSTKEAGGSLGRSARHAAHGEQAHADRGAGHLRRARLRVRIDPGFLGEWRVPAPGRRGFARGAARRTPRHTVGGELMLCRISIATLLT